MKVEIQLINERGRPVAAKTRSTMSTYRGVLRMREERVHELGRTVVVAKLVSSTDGTDSELVPALHEASMLFLNGAQLRVRGYELVGGIQFGQTWEIRVQ